MRAALLAAELAGLDLGGVQRPQAGHIVPAQHATQRAQRLAHLHHVVGLRRREVVHDGLEGDQLEALTLQQRVKRGGVAGNVQQRGLVAAHGQVAHQRQVGAGRVEARADDALPGVLVADPQHPDGRALERTGQLAARELGDQPTEQHGLADALLAGEQVDDAPHQPAGQSHSTGRSLDSSSGRVPSRAAAP